MSNRVESVLVDRREELPDDNMFKSYNRNSMPSMPVDASGELKAWTAEDYVKDRLTKEGVNYNS